VGRKALSAAGVIDDKDEAHLSGAPEFNLALRMQLLVGSTSYAIQQQSEYRAAFVRMTEGEEVTVQVRGGGE
jgi:hypothetical protein